MIQYNQKSQTFSHLAFQYFASCQLLGARSYL